MGNVWATALSGNSIGKYSPEGVFLGAFSHGANRAQGCVVGLDDDVWVAHSIFGESVGHILNNGTFVGTVPVGSGPTGVAVDGDGKIWSANRNSNSLRRIDPALNGGIGAVDLTVDLGSGAGPYNYGDMTGSATTAPPGQGSWTFVFDSGVIGKAWGLLDWIAETPSDSNVNVLVRTSTDGITFPSMFVEATPLVCSGWTIPSDPCVAISRVNGRNSHPS